MLLKFLGVLLVLLAIDAALVLMPAFAPMPRQSTKPTTQETSQVKNDCGDNQAPCPTSVAVNGEIQTGSQKIDAHAPAADNKQNQITVIALPEVSVSSDYKGLVKRLYDWGPWAFGLTVAVFSGLQVRLLWLTLKRVGRQAEVANRQAIIMVGQVKEMRKVSEIENRTLILQYRPRVSVRNTIVTGLTIDIGAHGECLVSFQIVNAGGSNAYIMGGAMSLLSVVAPSTEAMQMQFIEGSEGLFEQRTYEPGQREKFEDTFRMNVVIDGEWTRFFMGGKTNCSLYLQGTIWYKDGLNIPRQTGINRKYDPERKRFIAEKDNEDEYSD